jgi:hypothetical protein
MKKVYFSRLMRVCVGLIMLVASFCQSQLIKGEYILTTMTKELLAASVLFVPSGALLVSHNDLFNCPKLSQPKSTVHQQAARLFQQHSHPLKGNYDLDSAFENADRLLEQKRTLYTTQQNESLFPHTCHTLERPLAIGPFSEQI